jgi:hypothetical protein
MIELDWWNIAENVFVIVFNILLWEWKGRDMILGKKVAKCTKDVSEDKK